MSFPKIFIFDITGGQKRVALLGKYVGLEQSSAFGGVDTGQTLKNVLRWQITSFIIMVVFCYHLHSIHNSHQLHPTNCISWRYQSVYEELELKSPAMLLPTICITLQ